MAEQRAAVTKLVVPEGHQFNSGSPLQNLFFCFLCVACLTLLLPVGVGVCEFLMDEMDEGTDRWMGSMSVWDRRFNLFG